MGSQDGAAGEVGGPWPHEAHPHHSGGVLFLQNVVI